MSYNESEPELKITPIAIPLPLIHQSLYCVVHKIPAILSPCAALATHNRSSPGIVKVFQLKSAPDIQFNNVLVSLSHRRNATPEAYAHKNITSFQIIEVDVMTQLGAQTSLALVTPWYSNGNILTYLIDHPHVPKLTLAVQIGKAVEHLHRHGIVHGNIYPGNILITDDGHATLTDIAVRTQACNLILLPHATVPIQPSHIYQSPELILPGTDAFVQPVESADVYAFALTILTIFVGKPPFHGRFRILEQAIAEILIHGHSRIGKPEDIDDHLWGILKPCLNRDAAVRPRMAEVLTMLEDIELYE